MHCIGPQNPAQHRSGWRPALPSLAGILAARHRETPHAHAGLLRSYCDQTGLRSSDSTNWTREKNFAKLGWDLTSALTQVTFAVKVCRESCHVHGLPHQIRHDWWGGLQPGVSGGFIPGLLPVYLPWLPTGNLATIGYSRWDVPV